MGTEVERLLELSFPAVAASCTRARHAIRAALRRFDLDLPAVELAASEAVTNVVLHAYRDREGSDDHFHIRVTADEHGIWVAVVDDGVGMSPRDDSPGLGLGLRLITRLSDELLIVQGDTGTRVHMRFRFRAVPAQASRPDTPPAAYPPLDSERCKPTLSRRPSQRTVRRSLPHGSTRTYGPR